MFFIKMDTGRYTTLKIFGIVVLQIVLNINQREYMLLTMIIIYTLHLVIMVQLFFSLMIVISTLFFQFPKNT